MASTTELTHTALKMRSGFLPDRIIHLHPTRLCNLACLHCYSESAPSHTAALDPQALLSALAVLRAEQYQVVSLSGGEPLVYRGLQSVIDGAKALGFRVTMISNGLLATERMDALLGLLDGLAISFDGLAPRHDRLRGRAGVFERACAALERQASQGRPVGAAISLTKDAIPELPELAEHLVRMGARSLQIRPVARAGRAVGLPEAAFYTNGDRARLYLVSAALEQELSPRVRVHCDLAPAQGLWRQRDAYAGLLGGCEIVPYHDRSLADLVNPLVISDTGALRPIAFDFAEQFDLTTIDRLTTDRLRAYKEHEMAPLQDLIGRSLASLESSHEFVDWFDFCTRASDGVTRASSIEIMIQ